MSDRVEELAALAEPSGNAETCEKVERLLAWVEREMDATVADAEDELGVIVLPRGRARLLDMCMRVETLRSVEALRAAVSVSPN